jgi:hypothetical protein
MKQGHLRKLVAGLAALVVVAGTGAALAATGVLSPKEEREAFLNDAAKELGVAPSELSAALENALKKRVDSAVKAGRLTRADGGRIKARIDSGEAPLFFGGRGFGPGPGRFGHHGERRHRPGPNLDAAASYLGLTEDALHEALESGKTLAQVAKDRGKSVDGLIQALTAAKGRRLDQAVVAGRITKAERADLLAGLERRITDFVNGRFPPHDRHEFRGRGASLPFPTA